MSEYTNDRSRHQDTGSRPRPSSTAYSGDEVFTIPIGLLGLFALLVAMMLVFQP